MNLKYPEYEDNPAFPRSLLRPFPARAATRPESVGEKRWKNGYEDWEELEQDGRWARLRETVGYRALVGRYWKE